MLKRTKAERLAQQQKDTVLATDLRGIKAHDGCRRIFDNKLEAMPDRKLINESRNFQLSNKRHKAFSTL